MNYGLYTSYLGMRARMRTLEAIANNVANASTTGFKTEFMYFRSVEASLTDAERAFSSGSPLPAGAQNSTNAAPQNAGNATPLPASDIPELANLHPRALGVTSGSRFDFSQGAVRLTGRSLDAALEGDGLFVVQTPQGESNLPSRNCGVDREALRLRHQHGHRTWNIRSRGPLDWRDRTFRREDLHLLCNYRSSIFLHEQYVHDRARSGPTLDRRCRIDTQRHRSHSSRDTLDNWILCTTDEAHVLREERQICRKRRRRYRFEILTHGNYRARRNLMLRETLSAKANIFHLRSGRNKGCRNRHINRIKLTNNNGRACDRNRSGSLLP